MAATEQNKLEFVNEGWEDGPSTPRDFRDPAKIKKDSILFIAYMIANVSLTVAWEVAVAFGSFIKRLIFRPEPKSLKGRVCLVTGAGRGLGRKFCLALAREGAVLACVDINEHNNKTTAAMVKELGAKAIPYAVNVAIKKDVEDLVPKIEKELGPVYLLINNAALIYTKSTVNEEFIRASFNINTFGPLWFMNAVLPTMKMRNEGHIVNMMSLISKMAFPTMNIYGASKMSLEYLSNCVRTDLHLANKDNICVTNVYPSMFNSTEDYVRTIPMKINFVLEIEEVVKAVMDAIHYNYDEVFAPSIAKYGLILLTELLPSVTTAKLIQMFFKKWSLPNEEQEKHLPWGFLIKQGCLTEKEKVREN